MLFQCFLVCLHRLNSFQRTKIVVLRELKFTGNIAKEVGCLKSSAERVYRKFQKKKTIDDIRSKTNAVTAYVCPFDNRPVTLDHHCTLLNTKHQYFNGWFHKLAFIGMGVNVSNLICYRKLKITAL